MRSEIWQPDEAHTLTHQAPAGRTNKRKISTNDDDDAGGSGRVGGGGGGVGGRDPFIQIRLTHFDFDSPSIKPPRTVMWE